MTEPISANNKHVVTAESARLYFSTRLSTLLSFPGTSIKALSPVPAIRAMSLSNWNYFGMGFFAWTIDSMDFFCVSASATAIAESLNVSVTDITWGITLVLMLRSVGAFLFGIIGDNYGRKWTLITCLAAFVVLEIGTGFVQTYEQFLAVRAIFGIFMGACWSLAASTAMEDAPLISRGFLSGLFLPGYNLGYIFAVIFWRAFEFTPHSWRALFWFSAAPPFLVILWRLPFPEMKFFKEYQQTILEKNLNSPEAARTDNAIVHFFKTNKLLKFFKDDWLLFVYLIFLMAGFNFMSHGSQDLFPTMLKNQVGLGSDAITVTMVVVNLGALLGGFCIGQFTELTGRRFGIMFCCVFGGAFIYPTFFIHNQSAIMGAGFFLQFAVMGTWGIASVHLFELTAKSPYRTMISGLAYQLGNLASSASSTIESSIGSRFPLDTVNGKTAHGAYNYGKVMAIFMGCVFGYMLIISFLGPEKFHNELQTEEMEEVRNLGQIEDGLSVISSKPEVDHYES
ncbi:Jen1 protein [Saccharomycopsis crataegensis]|uniref:Jen1 protein n=1 Tax=Saccharomycopsis crataegensis TaxID=43959 RepID=A0AAV5QT25_9ASCO|nr:Jen1 protein [Saccharomycopsis crataegensis]